MLTYPAISPSSKGSPHSGQNLGRWVGSDGSQPHLSHLYWGTPAGFFAPHSVQNLPLLAVPHAGQVQLFAGSGLFAPHSGQNYPTAFAPQFGHVQLSAAGADWGANTFAVFSTPAFWAMFMPMKALAGPALSLAAALFIAAAVAFT